MSADVALLTRAQPLVVAHRIRDFWRHIRNRPVRRVLIESAWSCRHKPRVGDSLRARGRDASEAVRAIAWKAQKRLHSKYHRLIARGKSGQSAIAAVAREQLGFIWAIGRQVMEEQRLLATASV